MGRRVRYFALWHETDMPTALRNVRYQGQSGKHLLALSSSGFDPISDLRSASRPPTKVGATDGVLVKALRYSIGSRLSNLIVRNLVGFMYFEEAVPAAKCDTPANTHL
jgi:hypothetical protein